MRTLRDLFLDELADLYDAEHRLTKALPKMARVATDPELKEALLAHLEETRGHINKVQKVFAAFDEKPQTKTCEATVGLLQEGDEIAAENEGEPTLNAALISAAQKVEHYEIASYGCLHAWALLMGNQKAADLIEEILEEEKAANDKLTELSETSNQQALDDEDDDDGSESRSKSHTRSLAD